MFQIPDAFGRYDVKNKDLTCGLPTERALEIFWGAENDVIKFKIDLKDQQMTSQGILFAIGSIHDPLLGWHAYLYCQEEGFFKVYGKPCMVGMKWFLTASAKNGKHEKSVSWA